MPCCYAKITRKSQHMPLCCHPKVARQCQTFKTTSLHKFGPPESYLVWIFVILVMVCLLNSFFNCWLIWYQLQIIMSYKQTGVKTKKQKNPHLFLWSYIFFLECCNMSSKAHPTQTKTVSDKNDCKPHAFRLVPACKTESFLVICPWCQRHFDDVKMKHNTQELMKQVLLTCYWHVTDMLLTCPPKHLVKWFNSMVHSIAKSLPSFVVFWPQQSVAWIGWFL